MSANPGRYLSVCLLFVCCFVGLLAAPAAARAAAPPSSQPDGQVWVTNGRVLATAIGANGTSYIGGIFSYVGPQTGSGVALDVSSGVRDASFAMVQGSVFAVVPDGAGGFYIGGSFHAVGGLPAPTSPTSWPMAP